MGSDPPKDQQWVACGIQKSSFSDACTWERAGSAATGWLVGLPTIALLVAGSSLALLDSSHRLTFEGKTPEHGEPELQSPPTPTFDPKMISSKGGTLRDP